MHRSYKNFNETKFYHDLDQELLKAEMYSYSKLKEIFSNTPENHAPLKSKTIKGNHVPFMTKKLSKATMDRSRLRNKYLIWLSTENVLAYKNVNNKCNSLNKRFKKSYFQEATKNGIMSNKLFWNTVKLFLTNKGILTDDKIVIESENEPKIKPKGKFSVLDIKAGDIISDKKQKQPPEVFFREWCS